MSLKYYGRKVYDKRNGQICCPQKCKVKFGKNIFSQTFLSERIFLHRIPFFSKFDYKNMTTKYHFFPLFQPCDRIWITNYTLPGPRPKAGKDNARRTPGVFITPGTYLVRHTLCIISSVGCSYAILANQFQLKSR